MKDNTDGHTMVLLEPGSNSELSWWEKEILSAFPNAVTVRPRWKCLSCGKMMNLNPTPENWASPPAGEPGECEAFRLQNVARIHDR